MNQLDPRDVFGRQDRGLTLASNMLNDHNITDMETCYKAFTRDVVKAISRGK